MEQYKTYLTISAHLTGYNEVELLGTGMAQTYHGVLILETEAQDLEAFFKTVAELLNDSPTEARLADAIAAKLYASAPFKRIAHAIIMTWYTGNSQWYTGNGSKVISSQSYIEGLMWNTAQAHPPGAKQPGFGTWSLPPFA